MHTTLFQSIAHTIGDHKLVLHPGRRSPYAEDRWGRGQAPAAVFFPESSEDVSCIASQLYRAGVPMVPRGGGSGMTGGAIPLDGAVVVSLERMHRIHPVNHRALNVYCEPGVLLEALQQAVEREGLFYPPDPASADICTIGGNIAENSGGLRCVKYGVTGDYVLALDVVLPDGTPCRLGSGARKDVAGFDLKRLVIGSEGMLAFVVGALLKLLPLPRATVSFKLFFASAQQAVDTLNRIFMAGLIPAKAEFVGRECLRLVQRSFGFSFPENSQAALLLSFDGDEAAVVGQERRLADLIGDKLDLESAQGAEGEALWELRRSISPALKEIAPVKINEDVSVPLDRLADLVGFTESLAEETGLVVAVFGHAGDGNLHVNFMIQPEQEAAAMQAVARLFRKTVDLGGTITGEHGIGMAKAAWAGLSLSEPALDLAKRIKQVFDPRGLLNPGKAFYGPLEAHHLQQRLI